MSESTAIDAATDAAAIYRIPAMANVHSHAFQRDLRGVGERPTGAEQDDFWSWRQAMFAAVARLDPETIYDVSLRCYREMVTAGYGVVGEFHYVHHHPDGTPYEDPNAMAKAVAQAAVDAGLQIVLLPAAYHRNGWRDGDDVPPESGQRRFCDPDVDTFLERVEKLRSWSSSVDGVSVGVAAHSVRAVPASWLAPIASYADSHNLVRHIHAQEQPAELAQCEAEHGCSPLRLLAEHGFLSGQTTVIHATHLSDQDLSLLAGSRTIVGVCPTTEANLGDGFAPVVRLADAGVRMAIGSDSDVRLDPFEETRELETLARRESVSRRGLLERYGNLWHELALNGLHSLGVSGPGQAQRHAISLDRSHPTLAGIDAADLPFAVATCATAAAVIG